MPRPVSYKLRLIYFFGFLLVFLVGFPILVFYSNGYTFDTTLGLTIRGGVYVFTPEPNTAVYIGNELKSQSGFLKREVLVNNLKPDQYLVLAANEAFWPWAKIIQVKAGEVEALYPLLVPKVIVADEITTPASRKEILTLFASSTVPSSLKINKTASATTSPEVLTYKKVEIWRTGNTIYAQWTGSEDSAPKYFCTVISCTDPVLVFESFVPIRSFDFYPSRSDAIMLALDNGVYAVEIDRRPYQNFYPIYRGQQPDFRVSDNRVYIKDTNYLAELNVNQ